MSVRHSRLRRRSLSLLGRRVRKAGVIPVSAPPERKNGRRVSNGPLGPRRPRRTRRLHVSIDAGGLCLESITTAGSSPTWVALGFYRDLLGLTEVVTMDLTGAPIDARAGFDGAQLTAVMLTRPE